MIEIRKADISDAKHIALLGRITFNETFAHLFRDKSDLLEYHAKTFSVEKIRNGLVNADNVFFIATVNDLPVGYAKLKLNSRTTFLSNGDACQLQKIYVLEDFHSMKIGMGLQNLLLEEAKNRGYHEIWLSVLNSNHKAENFYSKNNFHKIGTHPFQIGKETFEFNVLSKKIE